MAKRKKSARSSRHQAHPASGRQRQQAAELAARIMVEGGIRDYSLAKAKAAERMGISDGLPSNAEIEQALIDYQQLFRADVHAGELSELRQTAREAMQFFRVFQPCLTGPVLTGSAGPHAVVELHLFTDVPEQVAIYLDDQRMPYETDEKRFKDARGNYQFYPCYRFLADDTAVEAIVFPEGGRRQAPPSLVDGKPMDRADLSELETLLQIA